MQSAVLDYLNGYSSANIAADQLYALLSDGDSGNDPLVLDYRGQDHFQAGHIEGAVNLSVRDLAEEADNLPVGRTIVNVGYSGHTASMATALLQVLGFDARNLLWGMCGWVGGSPWEFVTDVEGPYETSPRDWPSQSWQPPSIPIEGNTLEEAFLGSFDDLILEGVPYITSGSLLDLLTDGDGSNDPFIIHYANQQNYDLGHIPGAVFLEPRTWTLDDLDRLPSDGTPIVVFSYTGQTESQVASLLQLLGYNAKAVAYGMSSYNQGHPDFHGFTPPSSDYPVVTGP
jgi:rhodanese-related sulfurtransferase